MANGTRALTVGTVLALLKVLVPEPLTYGVGERHLGEAS
jgi:hypothetical protein